MIERHDHPIIAVATASGRGAVGIVRLSGHLPEAFVRVLCGRSLQPRYATYLAFRDADGGIIDKGLAIYFPGPHSYTGEVVLELQVHGGPVVLQMLVARCLQVAGDTNPATTAAYLPQLRLAQPGEFTERAFLNHKLDLAQAEAVADLINASTETSARSAARSLSGDFSGAVDILLQELITLRMLVESTLDFPEEDIDFLQKADAIGRLQRLGAAVHRVMQQAVQGAILREGIKVVIAGQPNAGKSSLLNALAGADVAIVTPIAGTTRDRISQLIQIDGVPLHIVDTAGLRVTVDEVEKIGVQRAWDEIGSADAVIFLHDLTRYRADGRPFRLSAQGGAVGSEYAFEDARIRDELNQKIPESVPVIDVWSKSDLLDSTPVSGEEGLAISTKLGHGIDELRQQLLHTVGWQSAPEGVFMARERHITALKSVALHLGTAQQQAEAQHPALDLLAEDLRQAQLQLSQVTGAFSSDDLLGEIFSKFCIGK